MTEEEKLKEFIKKHPNGFKNPTQLMEEFNKEYNEGIVGVEIAESNRIKEGIKNILVIYSLN